MYGDLDRRIKDVDYQKGHDHNKKRTNRAALTAGAKEQKRPRTIKSPKPPFEVPT